MSSAAAHLHAVDSSPLSDLQQAIRAALAHERAASSHEDKYEQQMKSAGASMYAAFTAALRACDEFRGRQISDRTILNVYQSPKPRPWWDDELAAAGVKREDGRADRERAARLIQWHVDPDAARARRAKHVLASASARKKLTDQRATAARGARAPRAPTRAEVDRVREASHERAHAGRAEPMAEQHDAGNAAVREAGRAQVLALLGRLQSKAKRVDLMALADAVDVLEAVERDFDEALA
jgi:hypothetical protein